MLVIGQNLSQLAKYNGICDQSLIEGFSLKIRLGREYFEAKKTYRDTVVYGIHPEPQTLFSEKKTITQSLSLSPGDRVIACSSDIYAMPLDHFGLVQTKGTLARLFVQATCNDGQIEPGFNGYITLEIVNLSPWTIDLPRSSEVAQLFLFKTSMEAKEGYSGRYAKASQTGPTLPVFVP